MSRINTEKAQQELEEAQATLAQLRETFALKRNAAHAHIRTLEIQRDRTQQIMLHARADAELLQIRAPLDGIVVLNTQFGKKEEWERCRRGTSSVRESRSCRWLDIHVDGSSGAREPGRFPAPAGRPVGPHALGRVPGIGIPREAGGDGSGLADLEIFPPAPDLHGSVAQVARGHDSKLMPDLSAAVDVDLGAQHRAPEVPQ